MSHFLVKTPSSRSGNGKTLYSSPGIGHDEREDCESDVSPSMQDTKDISPRASRIKSKMVTSLLVDFVSILVSIAILVFAFLGYRADGKIIGSREQKLLDIAHIAATAFPFVFALILGRTLQSVLSWRLEKGVDCLSFAYLSRSFTLGSAYTAPFQIRSRHWLPSVLIGFWAFSPLGSQALLRFITAQGGSLSTQLHRPVQYIYPSATDVSACTDCQIPAHNSMFMAPFFSIGTTGGESRDAWGNLKIPILDDFNNTKDANGWKQLTSHTEVQYTALLGIPVSIPQIPGNMTFLMKSWYWQLENATHRDNTSPGPLLATSEYNGSSTLEVFTGLSGLWQFGIPSNLNPSAATSIPLTFEVAPSGILENSLNITYTYGYNTTSGWPPDLAAVRLEAVLTQKPVELNVTCWSSACNVTALRHVAMDANYDSAKDRSYLVEYFLRHLTQGFPIEHPGTPEAGVLEAYLSDSSQNSYSLLGPLPYIYLSKIKSQTLALRLAQVLNTYWIVSNFFAHAAGSFNVSDPTLVHADAIRNNTITATSGENILHCDRTWQALLCILTLLMLFAAISSTILSFFRLAPDSTDFFSALSLNDGKTILENNSPLDVNERIRLMKDVRIKIGDVKAGEPIGKIVIGEYNKVEDLKKGRVYQ